MGKREFVIKIPREIRAMKSEELLILKKNLKHQYQQIMNSFVDLSRQKTRVWNDLKAVEKYLNQLGKVEHEKGGSR